jgi:hypothetical protein
MMRNVGKLLLELLETFKAGHARHEDVEQNEVVSLRQII